MNERTNERAVNERTKERTYKIVKEVERTNQPIRELNDRRREGSESKGQEGRKENERMEVIDYELIVCQCTFFSMFIRNL